MRNLVREIANRSVVQSSDEIDGRVMSMPALRYTDGLGVTNAVDVDIGRPDELLRNVPLARANRALTYAQVGNPVRLRRTAAGQWEVVGFSREMPGTYTEVPVNILDYTFGAPRVRGVEARTLNYDELGVYGVYGTIRYGAVGLFRDGQLLEIR